MALMYPWASREYLLWQMTIGQIFMYHNLGLEMKYPTKPEDPDNPKPLHDMNHEELTEWKTEMSDKYGDTDG